MPIILLKCLVNALLALPNSSRQFLKYFAISARNEYILIRYLVEAEVQHVLFGQFVLDHKLGEISDGFAGRRHFNDVAEELIGLPLRPFDGLELVAQSQRNRPARVLTTGELVEVDVGVARFHRDATLGAYNVRVCSQ